MQKYNNHAVQWKFGHSVTQNKKYISLANTLCCHELRCEIIIILISSVGTWHGEDTTDVVVYCSLLARGEIETARNASEHIMNWIKVWLTMLSIRTDKWRKQNFLTSRISFERMSRYVQQCQLTRLRCYEHRKLQKNIYPAEWAARWDGNHSLCFFFVRRILPFYLCWFKKYRKLCVDRKSPRVSRPTGSFLTYIQEMYCHTSNGNSPNCPIRILHPDLIYPFYQRECFHIS